MLKAKVSPSVRKSRPARPLPRAPGAPGDRTYTLREPNQRPRFAPRRRRGRRGPGGDRVRAGSTNRASQLARAAIIIPYRLPKY